MNFKSKLKNILSAALAVSTLLSGFTPITTYAAQVNEYVDPADISTEIGYGVVPMDKGDREWRETVGRTCCYIAKKADEVVRVVCGVGNRIK